MNKKSIDDPDGWKYWHHLRKKVRECFIRQMIGGSVTVLGAVSHGTYELSSISGKVIWSFQTVWTFIR